ncbi:TetR/AcrR family transcriptional regulator [Phenylobacterium sp.]|uniref:TetR/AcrR family transcriptional regulator n=1 Tax=Phenylobacterium sp. TaxID=1871053 RepID=UPI0025DE5D66|nr:TetR/AcrR family transcriptional regulator [Phenylobacterium sp.]
MPKALAAANDRTAGPRRREAREAARRESFMRVAAAVFREHGLAGATMEQVAAAAGVTKVVLYRRFPSKDALIQAIVDETIRLLRGGVAKPWTGYGAGIRKSLEAARSFADGYVLLIRYADQHPYCHAARAEHRKRSAKRLRALLWNPEPAPPASEWPPLIDLAVEPMISFTNEALVYWVENGDPSRDGLFIHWCGQMLRAWRNNAAELLNLDSPEHDWPFDTEAPP